MPAVWLRIRAEQAPEHVGGDADPVAGRAALEAVDAGWFYDAATRAVWVKRPPSPDAPLVVVYGVLED